MILCRSTSMLHFCNLSTTPKLLSHFRQSSFLSTSSSSPLSSSARIRLVWLNYSNRRRNRAFSSAAAVAIDAPKRSGRDTFFAEESVSWKSLGVSDRVSQSLLNAGFERPSLVQVLSFLLFRYIHMLRLCILFIFCYFSRKNLEEGLLNTKVNV